MKKILIFSLSLFSALLVFSTFLVAIGTANQSFECSPELRKRTPVEVVEDLQAAIAAGDWGAVACNYEPGGFIIDDQGIMAGWDDILNSIISFNDLFCDIQPEPIQREIFSNTVRVTYKLEGGWIAISDGVNTYHIEEGKIVSQANQGLITYSGPLPTDWCYDTL